MNAFGRLDLIKLEEIISKNKWRRQEEWAHIFNEVLEPFSEIAIEDYDEDEGIDEIGLTKIQQFARVLKLCRVRIRCDGHVPIDKQSRKRLASGFASDKRVVKAEAERLSEITAKAVRDAFLAEGVPSERVETRAAGHELDLNSGVVRLVILSVDRNLPRIVDERMRKRQKFASMFELSDREILVEFFLEWKKQVSDEENRVKLDRTTMANSGTSRRSSGSSSHKDSSKDSIPIKDSSKDSIPSKDSSKEASNQINSMESRNRRSSARNQRSSLIPTSEGEKERKQEEAFAGWLDRKQEEAGGKRRSLLEEDESQGSRRSSTRKQRSSVSQLLPPPMPQYGTGSHSDSSPGHLNDTQKVSKQPDPSPSHAGEQGVVFSGLKAWYGKLLSGVTSAICCSPSSTSTSATCCSHSGTSTTDNPLVSDVDEEIGRFKDPDLVTYKFTQPTHIQGYHFIIGG